MVPRSPRRSAPSRWWGARVSRAVAAVAAGGALAAGPARAQEPAPAHDPAGVEHFETKIRPLLAERCVRCHGPEKERSGLRLDRYGSILAGGDRGPAVVPGDPDASLLVEAIRYLDVDLEMPPKGPLAEEEVELLVEWVAMGAPGPAEEARPEAFDLEARMAHWAYQPLSDPVPPELADAPPGLDPVDAFVRARLAEEELEPAPPADRRALIRRLAFDLTGLPPTVEEVERFVGDETPAAVEDLVDAWLASPRFGETWARHWLDLVRYAETRGHEFDGLIPNAWQYRDYVIRALNADVPYDRFVVEHVAGDLLEPPRVHPETGANESILGTGFWFLGEETHSPVDIRADEVDRTANKVDVLSKAFLAQTVACARCHDHKFDPIPTEDYYALVGFVQSASYRQVRFESLEQNRGVAERLAELDATEGAALARAVGEALERGLAEAGAYLAAALARVRDDAAEPGGEHGIQAPKPADEPARAGEARGDLDPALLDAWAAELRAATGDPTHPLAALASGGSPPHEAVSALPDGARLLVDYRAEPAPFWSQDGQAFGPGPRPLGAPRFTGDVAHPLAGIQTVAAAAVDPTWRVLEDDPDRERDGTLMHWEQSGRTLRTASFVLASGRLHYLVRGAGRVYAGVDSHRQIKGPLHGKLLRKWDAEPGWRWVEQDLCDYAGHRAHLELSPGSLADEPPFAVACVVESDEAPPDPRAFLGLASSWPELELDDAALAEHTAQRLRAAAATLATGELQGARRAELADWLVRRPELCGAPDLREVAEPFIQRRAELVEAIRARSATAPAMLEGSGFDEPVLGRGRADSPLAPAPRRFLTACGGADDAPIEAGSGRLELARRMTDPARNPLIARVLVNRVWHHLYGRGIVASVDDFGHMGARPTHPELLDHLATRFVREGWSLKALIRALVLTRTYGQSSVADARALERDPANLLLARASVRRLTAEAIRDQLLAISGALDPTPFGPPVPVHLTPFMDGRGRPSASGPLDGAGRRSIYLAVRRNFLAPLFLAFDQPVPAATTGRRSVSNVPAQALTLCNDELVHELARRWAERLLAIEEDAPARVRRMYAEALARPPEAAELALALGFLEERAYQTGGKEELAVWTDLAHVLFNLKELVFLR